MKRSTLRRTAAIAVALAMTTASCGIFSVQSDVAIRQVPIDLVFGAKVEPTPTEEPFPFPSFTEPPPFQLPPIDNNDDDNGPPPPPPPAFCPPFPSAQSARDSVTFDMREGEFKPGETHLGGQEPREGPYLYRFEGNHAEKPPASPTVGYKLVSEFAKANDGSWTYTVDDLGSPGLSGSMVGAMSYMKLKFKVIPSGDDPPPTAGLYFAGVEWPKADANDPLDRIPFEPLNPIPMILYPNGIQPGESFNGSSPDVAPKERTGVNGPSGEVRRPSGSNIVSRVKVGSPELIEICDDLGQGWKITWELEITGEFSQKMVGQFWIATQYSGLPIRESYILESTTGGLVAGNFITNMMRLDPGDYL